MVSTVRKVESDYFRPTIISDMLTYTLSQREIIQSEKKNIILIIFNVIFTHFVISGKLDNTNSCFTNIFIQLSYWYKILNKIHDTSIITQEGR